MKGRLTLFLTMAAVLAVLAGLNAASYVRVEEEGDRESRPDRSTHNTGPTGTRALFEYLQQTGHDVSRWTAPPERLGQTRDTPATLIVVGRTRRPFTDEEAEAVLGWVGRGGRLVVVDRTPDPRLLPASDNWRVSSEVFDAPGPEVRAEDAELMTRGVPSVRPSQPTHLVRDVTEVRPSLFASRLHLYLVDPARTGYGTGPPPRPAGPVGPPARATGASATARFAGGQRDGQRDGRAPSSSPTPVLGRGPAISPPVVEQDPAVEQAPPGEEGWGGAPAAGGEDETHSAGDDEEEEEPEVMPQAPVSHLPDWRGGAGSLLVDYGYGYGRVVVLSDPYIVSNAGLRLGDNLFLAVNVAAGGGGRVAFDEYHQGFGSGRNELFSYFAGTPILWMFGQAGVLALAFAWTRGRRFARPLPAPRIDRRSKLEFVASMAELQLRARAYDLAVENVYGRVRRALARYGGTRADAPAAELAARVAARSGKDPARLEAMLRECEDAVAGEHLTARRAVALARELRALERELGLRTRARDARQAGRA